LLEVGCGGGSFLQAFKKLGVEVVGIEPSSSAAAARESGIDVFTGTVNLGFSRRKGGFGSSATLYLLFAWVADLFDLFVTAISLVCTAQIYQLSSEWRSDRAEDKGIGLAQRRRGNSHGILSPSKPELRRFEEKYSTWDLRKEIWDLRLTARRRPRISNLFFSLLLKLQSWRLAVVLSLVLAILSKI
jgi:SAM-dependent methyltransferase